MRERGHTPSGPGAAALQGSAKQLFGKLLLTMDDAARLVGITRQGMRKLARARALPNERTLGGQYLFRYSDVDTLVVRRAQARARQRHPMLLVVRPRMAKAQLRLPLAARRSKGDDSGVRSTTAPLEFPKKPRRIA